MGEFLPAANPGATYTSRPAPRGGGKNRTKSARKRRDFPPSLAAVTKATLRGLPAVGSNATVEDDRALLERLRAGDERAFEALVDRYDRALRRVARTFVRTDSSADEVVQETWLGVVRGLGEFEGRSSLRTWIFRILVNRARTRATRDSRSLPFSALETDEGPAVEPAAFGADGRWVSSPARLDGDPVTGLLSAELRQHLQRAVEGLSPDQRAVITLRDLVGLSATEVCDLLELSDANQRVLLHRARTRVRAALLPLLEVPR